MRKNLFRTIATVFGALAMLVVVAEPAAATHSATNVTPNALGQNAGIQELVITGSGFSAVGGAPAVQVSGTGVTVNSTAMDSATQLTANVTVAAGAPVGARNVTVTQGVGGLDSATCAGCLTINLAPTVTTVAPSSRGQGTTEQNVVVTGTGFVATPTVSFSGTGITVNNVVRDSATQLTVNLTIAGNAATGARNITVTNPDFGAATLVGGFTVNGGPAPVSFSPPGGSNTGTPPVLATLTVTGSNFQPGAQLALRHSGFSDILATGEIVNGPGTSISGTVDLTGQAATRWIVVVTNPDQGTATLGDGITTGFLVSGSTPTVTATNPSTRAAGSLNGLITLTGTNFARGATVSFGLDVTVTNPTWLSLTSYQVTIDVDAEATPGSRDVTLTNFDSQASAPCACFAVTSAPTITTVAPASRGQGASNQNLVLTGTGFLASPTVTVSGTGVTVNTVTFDSATQLTVNVSVASDATTGARTLTVTNTDGGAATKPFTVNAGPTVSNVTPASRGQNASTQNVVVTGANFVATPTVVVSGTGVTVDSVTRDSATQLTLVVTVAPTAPVGARDLTVVNPDAGTTTAIGAFTVNAGPTITNLDPNALARGATNATVGVNGGGFVATPTVVISGSGVTVNTVTRDSATHLTLSVTVAGAADTTSRNVTVTNPDAGTTTAVGAFTVNAAPTVTNADPAALGQGASESVTITGTGFEATSTVSFGSGITVDSVAFTDATELIADVTVASNATPGARTVTVTNTDLGVGTCSCFAVTAGPTISSITPAAGANSGTVSVTDLAGTGFAANAVVQLEREGFDPVPLDSTVVSNDGTKITGTFDLTPTGQPPVAPGAWTVRVTNPTDNGTATLVDGFTVTGSAPTVTTANPSAMSQGTTRVVELTGTGFADGSVVTVSGTGITVGLTEVVSATRIDVTLTAASDATTGARTITVTNADTQAASCSCLTINAAPTITTVAPSSRGQGATAQNVVITGTGFVATPTVAFSGTGITVNTVTRDSATQLTVNLTVADNAAIGARDVTVTNPDTGTATLVGGFTVNAAPTVTTVAPSSRGQGAASQNVVITGTGFVTTPTVGFSGTGITVNTVTRDSATQLTVNLSVAGSAATGDRDVTVTNPDAGTTTLTEGFTVNAAPTVTTVAPSSRGQGAASQNVVITGTGFVTTPTVAFSGTGITVNTVTRDSATQLTVNLSVAGNAATGARNVTVTNPDGGTGTLASGFTVNAAPTIITIAPNSRPQGATGQNVVITGTGYVTTPTVAFSGTGITVNTVTRDSATQLTVNLSVAGNAAAGARNVTVTNPDGAAATLVGGFTVNAAPTITTIAPNARQQGSGAQNVVITGTGFVTTPTVAFSGTGITVNSVTRDSATQLTVNLSVAGSAATGARNVTVTNPDGGTATLAGGFTVTAGAPIQLSGWTSLTGVVLGSPAVASTAPNTARVFVRSGDDAIWTRSFLNGGWTGWSSIGGTALNGPSASARGSAVDVFVHGGDGAVWQNTCQASCTGWSSLGGLTTSAPASVSWSANRTDVFIRGGDNQLWHRAANGAVWGEWEPLGGTLASAPSVTSSGVQSLDVAVRGTDSAVWTRSFNGTWGPWTRAGGQILGQPALVARPGGLVDLYTRGPDNAMWYSRRTSGTWQGFQSLGGGLTAGPAATLFRTSPTSQELVAVRGGDGALWVNLATFPA